MKQVYQSDWDEVKEKLHLDYMVIDCWGKAFTIDPVSLSDVMIVQGHSDGTISVSLEVSLEENAEALLGALEKEKEYFFAFKHRYPWREIIERKLSGGYVGKRFHYKVSKEKFKPQIKHEVIKLNEEHRSIVKSYGDIESEDFIYSQSYAHFDYALQHGYHCFGAITEEKLVSICCAWGNNINWVHTLMPFRNKGYGKSVVSAAVMDILEMAREATYDADDDNIASIKLCESLGFTTYDETLFFIGRPMP